MGVMGHWCDSVVDRRVDTLACECRIIASACSHEVGKLIQFCTIPPFFWFYFVILYQEHSRARTHLGLVAENSLFQSKGKPLAG